MLTIFLHPLTIITWGLFIMFIPIYKCWNACILCIANRLRWKRLAVCKTKTVICRKNLWLNGNLVWPKPIIAQAISLEKFRGYWSIRINRETFPPQTICNIWYAMLLDHYRLVALYCILIIASQALQSSHGYSINGDQKVSTCASYFIFTISFPGHWIFHKFFSTFEQQNSKWNISTLQSFFLYY